MMVNIVLKDRLFLHSWHFPDGLVILVLLHSDCLDSIISLREPPVGTKEQLAPMDEIIMILRVVLNYRAYTTLLSKKAIRHTATTVG